MLFDQFNHLLLNRLAYSKLKKWRKEKRQILAHVLDISSPRNLTYYPWMICISLIRPIYLRADRRPCRFEAPLTTFGIYIHVTRRDYWLICKVNCGWSRWTNDRAGAYLLYNEG